VDVVRDSVDTYYIAMRGVKLTELGNLAHSGGGLLRIRLSQSPDSTWTLEEQTHLLNEAVLAICNIDHERLAVC